MFAYSETFVDLRITLLALPSDIFAQFEFSVLHIDRRYIYEHMFSFDFKYSSRALSITSANISNEEDL